MKFNNKYKIHALTDGIIEQVEVQAGDQVESKDLLVKLR